MRGGLCYTLLGDGSSDRLLDYPIRWALQTLNVPVEVGQWADLTRAHPKPLGLEQRIRASSDLYPADLIFIHRDAERSPRAERLAEIQTAMASTSHPYVAIVPVRMTEAWFLHDADAIRQASGNPSGRIDLALPKPKVVESLPDPKQVLFDALLNASDLSGRRRDKKKREVFAMRRRVVELIRDYSALEEVPAFAAFIQDLTAALKTLGFSVVV